MTDPVFDPSIARWKLVRDGDEIVTPGATLLPVRFRDQPAMLKVSSEVEERRGGALMRFWNGDGAVRVFAQHGDALLMERATGSQSLAGMARTGRDNETSRILCAVAARLHAPRGAIPDGFVPLPRRFAALETAASRHGGIFAEAWGVAAELLAAPRDVTTLHGDLHHMNVLDAGVRGWLAIDPKCVGGERGFDLANIFHNPDRAVATAPGRLTRQLHVVADAAQIERDRLLRWVFAYSGLSAAWHIEDAEDPTLALDIAAIAAAELAA